MAHRGIKLAVSILLTFAASLSVMGQRSPDENWLRPYKAEITRTPAAIALIQSSLTVMNPAQLPVIQDEDLTYTISKWNGNIETGSIRARSIGLSARFDKVSVGGRPSQRTVSNGMSGTTKTDGRDAAPANHPMERLPYLPESFLEAALANPQNDIELLPVHSQESPTTKMIRITIKMSGWKPMMRNAGAATFDVSIDTTTSLVTKIVVYQHPQKALAYSVPHGRIFGGYQLFGKRLVPTSLSESQSGAQLNTFTLSNAVLNQGLTASSLSTN